MAETIDPATKPTHEEIRDLALFALQARDYAGYSAGQDKSTMIPRDRWMFPVGGEDNVMCLIPDAHKQYPDVRIVASYCIGHSFSNGSQLFRVEDCNLSNHGFFARKPKYKIALAPNWFALNDIALGTDTTKLIVPTREIMPAKGKEEKKAQQGEQKAFTDMITVGDPTKFTRVHLERFHDMLDIGFQYAQLHPVQASPEPEQVS